MGFEGARFTTRGNHRPLARWRINLRSHYSYLMLLTDLDFFKDNGQMKYWTDSLFTDALQEKQAKGFANLGFIPASVYRAAIEHYSRGWLGDPLGREALRTTLAA